MVGVAGWGGVAVGFWSDTKSGQGIGKEGAVACRFLA